MAHQPLASLGSMVLLLLLLLVVGAPLALGDAVEMPNEWEDICGARPSTNVTCTVQPPSSEPCTVYSLPPGNCFVNFGCMDNKTFNVNEHFKNSFDPQNNITNITILNNVEKRLLITTMQPDEIWWQVDLPDEGQNITITGLNGRLNETNPITKPAICEGCPPPRVEYIAQPRMHRFKVIVFTQEASTTSKAVSISVASSNDTAFSVDNCTDLKHEYNNVVHGLTEQELLILEMYSMEFCFVISVHFNSTERRFRCHTQENMIEPPFTPIQTPIDVPNWWVAGLGVVLICLVIGSIIPLAIHKGLLRAPCGRRATRSNKRHEEGCTCCSADRRSCRVDAPLLQRDGAAPRAPLGAGTATTAAAAAEANGVHGGSGVTTQPPQATLSV